MSKEHGEHGGVLVTQHFGGRDRGICLQLARYEQRDGRWVTVTVDEAIELGEFLKEWGENERATYASLMDTDEVISDICELIFDGEERGRTHSYKDVIGRVKELVAPKDDTQ